MYLFNKAAGLLIRKEILAQVFFTYEFSEIPKNIFLEHLRWLLMNLSPQKCILLYYSI